MHPVASREHIHWSRRAIVSSAIFVSFLIVLFVIGFAVLRFGLGGDELTSRARSALQTAAGAQWQTDLKAARITLDSQHFLAVEASGVTITNRQTGGTLGSVGSVRLGLAPLALLRGIVKIATVKIDGLHLSLSDLPLGTTAPTPGFLDKDGLLDARKIYDSVFVNASRTISIFSRQSTREISIARTQIDLPDKKFGSGIFINEVAVTRGPRGRIDLAGNFEIGGRPVDVNGFLARSKNGAVNLDLGFSNMPVPFPKLETNKEKDEFLLSPTGLASLNLSGTHLEGADQSQNILRANVAFTQIPRASDKSSLFSATVEIVPDERKVEIAEAKFVLGNTVLDFNGAVEPVAAGGPEKSAHYRYNAVSTTAVFAPMDSPEKPLQTGIKIAGTIDSEFRRFNGDELALRTTEGEVIGQLSVVRADKGAPALFLALHVPKLPVSQAKQLWPAFSAPGAREWVMQNVFGGQITDSSLDMSVGPGRFGSVIALNSDEINGHFDIQNTRFDITGDIPPVRDAAGIVDFSGTDVNIALQSGTAYLPSNRTVSASNGQLKIHAANLPPVVGDLSIDIAGKADAIAELASFEPINALRYVDLQPEQLSGDVSGHLNAEIPMSKERPDRKLGWSADLNYSGLAISKPIDGQDISNAKGQLKLEPGLAVFVADAELNNIPAHLNLVEPFGEEADKSRRKRDITLTLDDSTRAKVAKGLNEILKGPVKITFLGEDSNGRKLSADLGKAELSLPWVGWTKGAGIPATATFVLENDGSNLKLSDFVFTGDSFGATGDIKVSDGSLSAIEFPKLALNRDDDFSLNLSHSASGYRIAVKGNQADLRPVIKKYRKLATANPDINGDPVHLVADLGTVKGFNDQAFNGFHLELDTGKGKLKRLKSNFAASPEIQSVFDFKSNGNDRAVKFNSPDLGVLLKFLGSYEHMKGGRLNGALAGSGGAPLTGEVDIQNFALVDEPRLKSLTAAGSAPGQDRRFADAFPTNFDTSSVAFDLAYAAVENGSDYLKVDQGIIRGPVVGTTFEGFIYGRDGKMALTGTFLPAYGINSAFSQIPVLGYMLGNGRDRGLIGLTYKLTGDPASPDVQVNPLSVIAPGIFRSIFEFR